MKEPTVRLRKSYGDRSPFVMTEKLIQKWKFLLENSAKEMGVHPDVDPEKLPSWLDPEQLRKAQAILCKHRAAAHFSSLSGLLLILQVPMSIMPLLQTGKSKSLPDLFIRYLDTAGFVKKWYENDLLDKEGVAWKSLMAVRRKHQRIHEEMKSIPCPYNIPGTVWVNQYGMFATQWAFIGLFMMFPEECGLHFQSDEEREEVLSAANTVWRALGFLHGIKDEYNMCQEDYRDTIDLCHVILNELFMPLLTKGPSVSKLGYDMALDIMKSLRDLMVTSTPGSVFLCYWYRIFGVPEEVMPPLSLRDRIRLTGMSFMMHYLMKYEFFVERFSKGADERYERTQKNKEKIREKLQATDGDIKYTWEAYNKVQCPFALQLMPKPTDYPELPINSSHDTTNACPFADINNNRTAMTG